MATSGDSYLDQAKDGNDYGNVSVSIWERPSSERRESKYNHQYPGRSFTPSWVAFTKDERLVGDAAKIQAPQILENTVFDPKRTAGHQFSESDVQKDMSHWPFKVVNRAESP
ncbi:ATPase with role in protein import into the ER [Naganishia albida]|nr:ATPase with role in protein import into the ER [Naganishia albida]